MTTVLEPSSLTRLTPHNLPYFQGPTLFHRVARSVCMARVLPRKELFESWEVARAVRRSFRGGRAVDLACGHGLLAQLMLILDGTSPSAVAVDAKLPPSAHKLAEVLTGDFPHLRGRVELRESPLEQLELVGSDVVVSVHACGFLTDTVLERAASAGARVAVLPCCHPLRPGRALDLEGWADGALAMDLERAVKLRSRGYAIHTRCIPESITPKNRLLLGEPAAR